MELTRPLLTMPCRKTPKTAVLTFRPRSATMGPMLAESKKQFSFTRAAHSTMSGEKAISYQ
jgi:hypothetical protein